MMPSWLLQEHRAAEHLRSRGHPIRQGCQVSLLLQLLLGSLPLPFLPRSL